MMLGGQGNKNTWLYGLCKSCFCGVTGLEARLGLAEEWVGDEELETANNNYFESSALKRNERMRTRGVGAQGEG